ncbi:uncharacterized protein LOC120159368 [Hibiscus syriacus]|uniref:uncharacterized protein LOC120159368 n=1 Tax=Hibiscus syriacus TaxID=106335 RepID=UPI001924040E|nr:uncharacterized protein LOC120159368 [Hibiscus syriacus]
MAAAITANNSFYDFTTVLLSTAFSCKTNPNPFKLRTKNRINWVIGSVTEGKELAPFKTDHSDKAKKPNASKISESSGDDMGGGDDDVKKMSSRAFNASIFLGFGTLAASKLLTIEHDYWHGWTLYEVLRYVPEHNWVAYEQALKANPVIAKIAISGYEGKPLFDFGRIRLLRSGLVGFTLHGSLSHYYYQFCEVIVAVFSLCVFRFDCHVLCEVT